MEPELALHLATLIRGQRWAALATLGAEGPEASHVAYALEGAFEGFLLHLSQLAAHTKHLLAEPRASLAIGEPDDGRADPQTLARVTLTGRVEPIERGSDDYRAAQAVYLARLPESAQLFGFADFRLFRLRPARARFVGGFAQARTFDAGALRAAGLLPTG